MKKKKFKYWVMFYYKRNIIKMNIFELKPKLKMKSKMWQNKE